MTDAPAARNVLDVLTFIGGQAAPVRAATIARALGLPRSTTYKLIRVLQDAGYVMHFPEGRSYALSLRASGLVADNHDDYRLEQLARPLLRTLVTGAGVPVVAHLGALRSNDVVYLAKVSSHRAPTLVTDIGVHLPAHLTATGRSMLAHLTREQLRALYPNDASLVARTSAGPRTVRELRALIAGIQERGWAEEDGDVVEDYGSVAAACLDHNGYPVASVGITFRGTAVNRTLWPELGAAVRVTAGALSQRIHGRG